MEAADPTRCQVKGQRGCPAIGFRGPLFRLLQGVALNTFLM
ncbi:hypothetical protein SLEP1_g25034 [Rubroshorea leprosula]|uniref:Uncharacterized protein n=1 Tax=Rubroshorea leprosula TaxID=152421 RepID=A0AAV5JHU9_9ROSI|nr:hypothetical protein SLEP1_g25034 [Rubroshorea leprosula]